MDTFVLLRDERVNARAEEASTDVVEYHRSSHVEDASAKEHQSASNDVIYSSYIPHQYVPCTTNNRFCDYADLFVSV